MALKIVDGGEKRI